ncbi:unnamed protein product [Gongylonema pulchrum]|uniref:C2H2-type domain-containing protein n=1 Tax=Gongylonema pulchrum TaxID=637853 RepID=A0A183EWX0_9BILA|nr:unnamed protein product [Gongylonema pulchrum]
MNVCQYNNCGLHFANLHDLLQHIEETHIGPIEEEMKKKEAMAMNAAGGDESMKSAPVPTAFPLSTDLRLFPVLPEQKAKPIKYEPFRLQFCHYRYSTLALKENLFSNQKQMLNLPSSRKIFVLASLCLSSFRNRKGTEDHNEMTGQPVGQ